MRTAAAIPTTTKSALAGIGAADAAALKKLAKQAGDAAQLLKLLGNEKRLLILCFLSVRGEMSRVLKVLVPTRYAEFTSLFAARADVAHLIVTFLALLELAREQLIAIAQAEPYAPIYVQLQGERAFALAADSE